MKIRWMQNSLRLRITPSELAALQKGAILHEELRLPFALTPVWEVNLASCSLNTRIQSRGSAVQVFLNVNDLERLSSPPAEGIYFSNDSNGLPFAYYIEKDFPCAHPRTIEVLEELTETFVPPLDFLLRK